MDSNLFEVSKLFIRLYFAWTNAPYSREDLKKLKRLRIKAKRVLRDQNMEMSLLKLEQSPKDSNEPPCNEESLFSDTPILVETDSLLSFNEWLHALVVRPYGPLTPDIVKEVIESLELDDLRIDMDIDRHSKMKQVAFIQSRKRKNIQEVPPQSAEL
jgi:hypothetical protein